MQGKKVVAAVSSLIVGVTAVFSCVPISVQAEAEKVQEVIEEVPEETQGEEGQASEDIQQKVESVPIDEEHFPDEVFREYVKTFDSNGDGILIYSEFPLEISKLSTNVSSLKGIEYFDTLESLQCNNTQITELDLKGNPRLKVLQCNDIKQLELDLSKNSELEILQCLDSGISKLDLSQNPKLRILHCMKTKISSLDISSNLMLRDLECSYTEIENLDISNNIQLETLSCENTPIIKLDVGNNTKLRRLNCCGTRITQLDVTRNPKLTSLFCSDTGIKNLDVRNNTKLDCLNCCGTRITQLDVTRNVELTWLICFDTDIKNLNLQNNLQLERLWCWNTKIHELNVKNNSVLKNLDCSSNAIKELDISKNVALETLSCYNTSIGELDVSNNLKLRELSCSNTLIKNLDVSFNSELRKLGCDQNNLVYLNIGNNSKLELKRNDTNINLKTSSNKIELYQQIDPNIDLTRIIEVQNGTLDVNTGIITVEDMKQPVIYMYDCGTSSQGQEVLKVILNLEVKDESVVIPIDEEHFPDEVFREYVKKFDSNKNDLFSEKEISKIKNIDVGEYTISNLQGIEYFSNLEVLECQDTSVEIVDVSQNKKLRDLDISNTKITEIDIKNNQQLEELNCSNTKVKSLDLGNNPQLELIWCSGTEITQIDVRKNKELTHLWCWKTPIDSIDVSQNPNLEVLDCNGTRVKMVDVSQNKKLRNLDISNTKITEIDIKNNQQLEELNCSNTKVKSLDLGNNPQLELIWCSGTEIEILDVSKNLLLERLSCMDTNINELNLKNNKELVGLSCSFNDISELNVSDNKKLQLLFCSNTEIKELDVSQNPQLEELDCSNAGIQELNVSNNTKLQELECAGTEISELDLRHNTKLQKLTCYRTRIDKLDVSNNSKLEILWCGKTKIKELDVSQNPQLEFVDCISDNLAWLNIGNNLKLELRKSVSMINAKISGNILNMLEQVNSNIDLTRIIEVQNGTLDVNTGIITVEDIKQPVIYLYDCGTSSQGQEVLKVILNLEVSQKPEELNEVPVIQAEDKILTVGEEFDPLKDVTATDKEDGDLTGKIEILKNTVNVEEAGTYEVTYQVTDSKGASSTKTIFVTVNPKMEELNEVPVIQAEDKILTVGEEFDPLKDVTATDKEDGDLTGKIEILKNTVNMEEAGTYEVTYQVTDSKGASSTKTIFVTVNPKMEELNEVPVIQAEDKILTVGEEFDPLKDVTATDKEDGDLTGKIEILKNTVNVEEAGTYEVTYQVTDSKGASSTKTIFVTVNPKMEELNEVPVIQAEDKTLTVGEEFDPLKDVTATDKEDGDLTGKIEILKNTVNMEEAGTYEVTYQVTDSKGASSTKTIFVTVNPKMEELNEVPVIQAEDKILTVGEEFDPLKDVTATDKEDGDLTGKIEILKNTVNVEEAGTYEVTYQVTDSKGASSTKTIFVTVNPKMEELNEVPVIQAEDKTLTVGEEFEPLKDVTATDKEDGDLTGKIEILKNTVNVEEAGTYEVTYQVTDSKGASSTKTIFVTVNPKMEELNEVPVIQAEDKILTVGEEFDPLKDVTATDKEDGDLTGKIEILKNTVNMEEAGTYEVTYQVTDSKGASSTKTIFVTVNPKMEELNEVPVIQAEDKTLTVGEEFDPLKDVTATDKEDGDLTGKIEILKNTVNVEEAGTYEVTYQVTDSKGASSTKTIFVTVNPKMEELNEVPVIQAEDKTLTVGEEFDPLKDVTATDKEDGDLTGKIEILKNTVNVEEAGTYEVTYQVTDSKGASSTKTIFVTVNPKMEELNEVPVIQAEDKTLTVGEEFDPLKDVTATDKEDGDLTGKIEILKNTVNVEEAGTYEVTYQVTDSKGASSTKTIFVTVNPKLEELNEVPVIQAEDKTLTVGEEFEPLKDVTATDKEDGDLTGKIEILKNTVNVEEAGTYEVTYQVTDSKGASSTKTIFVTVNPKLEELNEVPVIQAEDKTLTVGEEFEPLKDVTATDKEDGDLTGKIEILKNTVNVEEAGTYEVTYQVTDSKGASSTKTIFVTVNPKLEEPTVPEVPDKPNDVTKPDKKPEMDSIVPETADVSNIGGMASMLMGSAGLLVVLFGNRRKK